jgi:hypothetical protein
MKSPDGSLKIASGAPVKLPDWIPAYPSVAVEGNLSMQGKEGETGSFSFKSRDPVEKIARFYEDGLKKAGLRETANITSAGGQSEGAIVTGEDESKKRSVLVSIGTGPEGSTVNVTYTVKK